MAYYRFNLHDGSTFSDEDGMELSSLESARRVAAEFLGAAIKDAGAALFTGRDWRLDVTDALGVVLFTIQVLAHEATASLRSQPSDSMPRSRPIGRLDRVA